MALDIARPSPASDTVRAAAEEFREDKLFVAWRESRSSIPEFNLYRCACVSCRNLDGSSPRGVLQRILDQINKHLFHEQRINGHQRQAARKIRDQLSIRQLTSKAVERNAHYLLQWKTLFLKMNANSTTAMSSVWRFGECTPHCIRPNERPLFQTWNRKCEFAP